MNRLFPCLLGGLALAASAAAAQAPPTPLIEQMEGRWSVEQRMWPSATAAPTRLPAATATRKRVGTSTIEETMTLAPEASGDAFTRLSVLNFNDVAKRFEYFSIDTRAPQQMVYESAPKAAAQVVKLQGGRYFAPEWGAAKNVTFRYRLEVGPVVDSAQRVGLYLTPEAGLEPRRREFLAFEYRYRRMP